MSRTGRRKDTPEVLGLLDVGTTKIVCLIVQSGTLGWQIIGIGHQRSRGLKAGVVVDLDQAEEAVRATVAQAEAMARIELSDICLAVSCGRLASRIFTARADTSDGLVSDDDVARVLTAGRAFAERDGRCLVHLNRLGWRLDGTAGVAEPVGMAADRIEADLHAVTADDAPLRNLLHVAERCYLEAGTLAVTAHASAVAVTSEDERRLGVTVVDLGGGATTIAEMRDDQLVGVHSLPIGGNHVTFDLARTLAATVGEAERVKTLHGTLLPSLTDAHELVSYRFAEAEAMELGEVDRSEIREIVTPRIDTMLALIAERLATQTEWSRSSGPVVLTGGASQLTGLIEHAGEALRRPIRLGRPLALGGLPDGLCTPAFATAVGLLPLALAARTDRSWRGARQNGVLGHVGRWMRESF